MDCSAKVLVFHTTVEKPNSEEADVGEVNILMQKSKQYTPSTNKRLIEKIPSKHEDEEGFNLWRLTLSGVY